MQYSDGAEVRERAGMKEKKEAQGNPERKGRVWRQLLVVSPCLSKRIPEDVQHLKETGFSVSGITRMGVWEGLVVGTSRTKGLKKGICALFLLHFFLL